jgi:hypothetical protein
VVQAFVYQGLTNSGGSQFSFALGGGADVRTRVVGPLLLELYVGGQWNVTRYGLPGSTPGSTSALQLPVALVSALRIGIHFP